MLEEMEVLRAGALNLLALKAVASGGSGAMDEILLHALREVSRQEEFEFRLLVESDSETPVRVRY
jgi:hypothetical protein